MSSRRHHPLDVLYVASWYPSKEDPVRGTFVRAHARAAASVNSVTVLAASTTRSTSVDEGGEVEPPVRWVTAPALPGLLRKLDFVLLTVRLVVAGLGMARTRKPDVVHGNTYETALACGIVGRLLRVPVVVSEHYSGINTHTLTRARAMYARAGYRLVDRSLPVTHELGDAMGRYGISTPATVVPNAVDTTIFHPGPETARLVPATITFVGRLVELKGVDVLLHALHDADALPDFRLCIVGAGPQRSELEGLALSLGLGAQVEFLGQLPQSEIADLLRKSSLLVLPSWTESLPCVVLEALCCGVPVVATRVGGLPAVIDDDNGRLVEPGNVGDLAQAVAGCLAASFDPATIARAAHLRYSSESVGQMLDREYRHALTSRRGS